MYVHLIPVESKQTLNFLVLYFLPTDLKIFLSTGVVFISAMRYPWTSLQEGNGRHFLSQPFAVHLTAKATASLIVNVSHLIPFGLVGLLLLWAKLSWLTASSINVYSTDSFFKILLLTAKSVILTRSSLQGRKFSTPTSFLFLRSFVKFQLFSLSFLISLLIFLALSRSFWFDKSDSLTLLLASVSLEVFCLDVS